MSRTFTILAAIVAMLSAAMPAPVQAERIRDLGMFQGVRSNQLTPATAS
jgi:flagellar basal body P-ring protein FlgI